MKDGGRLIIIRTKRDHYLRILSQMQLKKCDSCAKVLEFYHLGKYYLKKREEKR